MNDRVTRFVKESLIFLFGSFGSKFLTMLLLPFYTTVLTTGEYGELDIILTTLGLLMPIVTLGLVESIFRFAMSRDVKRNSVLSNGFLICAISYLIVFALAVLLNCFIHWDSMVLMFVLLFANLFYDILCNYLKAIQKSKEYVAIGMFQTFVNLSLNIVFLAVFHWGIFGYIMASALSFFSSSLIVLMKEKAYKEIGLSYFDKKLAIEMMRYSFPLIFSALSWWIITSSDKYIIKYMSGNEAVGVYSITSKIPLILQTVISILQTVWQISTNQIFENEPEKLKENFEYFTKRFRQTGFLAGSVLILLTKPMMYVIAQNDFYSGWRYAPFLILSVVFSFATGMVSTLYGAYKYNKGILYSVLLGGALNIILNFALIQSMGVLGATVSTAVSRLAIAAYRLKDTEKLLAFDRGYREIFLNCSIITLQCVALIWMPNDTILIQLAFVAVVFALNREVLKILVNFMKKGIYNIHRRGGRNNEISDGK